jgi:anthranilate phosphoribosyltransferase
MTDPALSQAIKSLARSEELPQAMLTRAFDTLLSGDAGAEQVGAFLMGLAIRGETANELFAGATAMRRHARTVQTEGPLLDTCGTGGLAWKSLNTSTASAIVIAAAGGRVAKHGNRSVPPKTGSADVLEALGVELDISANTFSACLDGAGVGFLYARSHHSAMRHVAPVRANLGIRTIFNLLGPLSNPANATHQILGVYDPRWLDPMAETLNKLGIDRAWVVHGVDGIDEISISGETQVRAVQDGVIKAFTITPQDAGLQRSPLAALEGGSPETNSAAIRDLFDGRTGPFREVVLLNAGAGLYLLELASTLKDGVALAAQAIDSGKAMLTLSSLVRLSTGN